MSEKEVIAWSLLLILTLLLGLTVVVVLFGVLRHLRRQRQAGRRARQEPGPAIQDEDWDGSDRRSYRGPPGGGQDDD